MLIGYAPTSSCAILLSRGQQRTLRRTTSRRRSRLIRSSKLQKQAKWVEGASNPNPSRLGANSFGHSALRSSPRLAGQRSSNSARLFVLPPLTPRLLRVVTIPRRTRSCQRSMPTSCECEVRLALLLSPRPVADSFPPLVGLLQTENCRNKDDECQMLLRRLSKYGTSDEDRVRPPCLLLLFDAYITHRRTNSSYWRPFSSRSCSADSTRTRSSRLSRKLVRCFACSTGRRRR